MTQEVTLADLLGVVSAAGGCDDPSSRGNLRAEHSGAATCDEADGLRSERRGDLQWSGA